MAKIRIEVDEKKLRELVAGYIVETLGTISFTHSDIVIQAKSAQNYKAEWEKAGFRAILEINT